MSTPKHALDLELVPDDVIEEYAIELFCENQVGLPYHRYEERWNLLPCLEQHTYLATAEKKLLALEWKNIHDPMCDDDHYVELREKLGIVMAATPQD